jgi:hypothetical protein
MEEASRDLLPQETNSDSGTDVSSTVVSPSFQDAATSEDSHSNPFSRHLIIFHGLPASGKYTLAKEFIDYHQKHILDDYLKFCSGNPEENKPRSDVHNEVILKDLSFKFFHNHIVVDTLFTLFDWNTPSFKRHR